MFQIDLTVFFITLKLYMLFYVVVGHISDHFREKILKKLESYKANKKEEFFLTPFVLRKVK